MDAAPSNCCGVRWIHIVQLLWGEVDLALSYCYGGGSRIVHLLCGSCGSSIVQLLWGLGGSSIVHLQWSVINPALSYCYGCVVDPALSTCCGGEVDPALSTCCGVEVDPALSNPEEKMDLIPFTLSSITTTKLYSLFLHVAMLCALCFLTCLWLCLCDALCVMHCGSSIVQLLWVRWI